MSRLDYLERCIGADTENIVMSRRHCQGKMYVGSNLSGLLFGIRSDYHRHCCAGLWSMPKVLAKSKKSWMVSVSDQRISRRTSPTRRADVFLLDVFLIQPMSSMHRHSACSFPATSPAIDSSKSHKNELLCFLRFRSHPFAGRQLHFLLGLCPVVELHRRSGQCRRTIDSAK